MHALNSIDVQVGTCLRKMRFQRGWFVHTLAKAIGVTSARLLEFESGETRIEPRIMSEMCRALGVPPSAFFAWIPNGSMNATPARHKLDAA
ncbi:hypothetical protein CCR94_09525 [Rhodoblastus sphagnicola]|uniref:HTH cro/C1-type domain-containing protein n=1 Tax=Rhodoblastus sphagnicola TaxID=333368 RepID=A0A2S6N9Q8_9HYPH|nr:hypothetical protein CCR94_09525 [Rhodoblastus sphagnicola]